MHKPFLATLLVFDIQHDRSYDMPGCMLDEQCLPPGLRSTLCLPALPGRPPQRKRYSAGRTGQAATLAVSGHLGMRSLRSRCRQDRQTGSSPP